ncbi:hypothetical protein [Winogradskyella arenosi]|uniref:Uncharacterized protein n=1 Tax=Winogradskyella arenosi TaxID=533325 RepID=A0A368ZNX9_9FLAO|nr:hypothetical protein [Winogradskyella arenosi]RCW93633.1 hypothetical protein DFQ08_101430 [Winogradskyella arenosi]
MKKDCNYCQNEFNARRKNHIYCSNSCKTLASYKRNNYKYVAGHYEKKEITITKNRENVSNLVLNAIKELENKIEVIAAQPEINSSSISNSAIGSAAVDVSVYAAKKLFAPHTLSATKGDMEILKKEINELKFLISRKNNSLFQ